MYHIFDEGDKNGQRKLYYQGGYKELDEAAKCLKETEDVRDDERQILIDNVIKTLENLKKSE